MTTPTTHDWSLLDQLLQRDALGSEQLLALFREERSALESRNYALFETLTAPKKQLVEQLEKNQGVRQQHLRQLGFSSDIDALEAAQKRAPDVAKRWQAVAELWQECQTANQVNEQICRRTRLIVERTLDILRGQHEQNTVYNARGTAQRSGSGRTISSA